MSYDITVYFNDVDIASTDINTEYFTHTGYYGNDSYFTSGLTFDVYFTANPANGCKFTQWVYRYVVDGVQSKAMTSTDNPFRYDGSEGDLIIRAEGEKASSSQVWKRYTNPFDSISSSFYIDIGLGEYELYCYEAIFKESGTASFYTTGTNVDVCGYLGTTSAWDEENGTPTSYKVFDDNGNGAPNFRIEYEVKAQTSYYIWMRGLYGYESGNVRLYIDPPTSGGDSGDGLQISASVSGSTLTVTITSGYNSSQTYILMIMGSDYSSVGTKHFSNKTTTYNLSSLSDGNYIVYIQNYDTGEESNYANFTYSGTESDGDFQISASVKNMQLTVKMPDDHIHGDGYIHNVKIIDSSYSATDVDLGNIPSIQNKLFYDSENVQNLTLSLSDDLFGKYKVYVLCFLNTYIGRSNLYTFSVAKVRLDEVGEDFCKFYIKGLDENYGSNNRKIKWVLNGVEYDLGHTIGANVSEDGPYVIEGLTPNTTYEAYAIIYNTSGVELNPYIPLDGTFTTLNSSRPALFEWTNTKEKEKGKVFDITATEWNSFTTNINAVRLYRNPSASSWSFTMAVKGKPFTAAMYNEAVNAIKSINGYGSYLTTVNPGDPITAWHLNWIVEEINAVP